MRRNRWLPRVSLGFALLGIAATVLINLLDKDGRVGGGRLLTGKVDTNLGTQAWIVSPLVALAGLCAGWRHNRFLAAVGVAAMAAAVGVMVWGTLLDYLGWRDTPSPQDQVTYLGMFFGFLGALAVCLAYGLLGTGLWVVRSARRRRAERA